AESTLREHATIVGHELLFRDDLPPGLPDRRAATETMPAPPRGVQARHIRLIACAVDLSIVTLLVMMTTAIVPASRWPILGITAVLYYSASLALIGCSPAVW